MYMKDYFVKIFRERNTFVLMFMSVFSLLLSVFRVLYTSEIYFLFMIWNLFLAFVPWFLISIIYVNELRRRWAIVLITVVWIAFFPNAPYILTDLIHLGRDKSAPVWYDLILLLSYGFTGLIYGFSGLEMFEKLISKRAGTVRRAVIIVSLIYVSCFGVYIGRFLRWNSWDLLLNLDDVFKDVVQLIGSPVSNIGTWIFTFLFGTMLTLLYYGYRDRGSIERYRDAG